MNLLWLTSLKFLPAGLYILAALIVFFPALFPPEGMMIGGGDIGRQYYFFRQFFNSWLARGIFPWWNPYLFGGEPFIANPVVNIWYLPTWLFSVLPLPRAYAWHIAGHVVWAAMGMYLFVRTLIGTGNRFSVPAFVSGCVYAFSGFFMARTAAGHVDVIAAASWMPWVVWRFVVLSRSESRTPIHTVFAATAFAMQLFAGYQTMALFTVGVTGLLMVAEAIRVGRSQPVMRSLAAGIAGLGLAAIQIIPEQELFTRSIRTIPLPYDWYRYGSLTAASFSQLVNPFFFGTPGTYAGPPPNFYEHSMFVGLTGLTLATIGAGAAFGKTLRYLLPFLIAVIGGFWISLGPNAPIDLEHLLWKTVPMYRYLRIPPRHLLIADFGLAVLAGVGASVLLSRMRRVRWPAYAVAGIVTLELVLFGRSLVTLSPVPESRHDRDLIALLTADTKPYRLLEDYGVWLPEADALDFDAAMAYGIHSATGYDPTILRTYFGYVARASGKTETEAMLSHDVQIPYLTGREADTIDYLNIKYLRVPTAYDPFAGNPRYRLLTGKGSWRLYENTTVRERFFLRDGGCGVPQVTEYTPNRIRISVSSVCDTHLDSSEVFYPGWTAFVDSKKTDILRLNEAFRTIKIPAGPHTVEFVYRPVIFAVGGLVSAVTLVFLAISLRRRPTVR